MIRPQAARRPQQHGDQCAVKWDRNFKPKLAIMRQCTSVTDRRTDRGTDGLASWHKREMYILHLALTKYNFDFMQNVNACISPTTYEFLLMFDSDLHSRWNRCQVISHLRAPVKFQCFHMLDDNWQNDTTSQAAYRSAEKTPTFTALHTILDRESDKNTRWIKEAVRNRKEGHKNRKRK